MFKIVNAWHIISGTVIVIARMSKIIQARRDGRGLLTRHREQYKLQRPETHNWFLGTIRNVLFLKHQKPGR